MILTIEEITEKVAPIAKKYNLKEVYLFGSYARGEAREDSDIDLLYVKFDNSMSLTTKYMLLDELEDSLGKKVDLVSLQAFVMNKKVPGTDEILENIEQEREEIYAA
ncbi:nucleotidyltransferase domain-containing protein [Lactococcus petauri]|uniref:nucleotidyltransferase family protein n=1 Tax=Lactococcus TaxID=1357 RepID=UPI0024C4E200|nr:nucleotidyltransferase domain-containing protein [Lactococcus sp. bn62]WKY24144.1 nucleotidyltransferase domain-containing protein [Lactococcus sp. bn62]